MRLHSWGLACLPLSGEAYRRPALRLLSKGIRFSDGGGPNKKPHSIGRSWRPSAILDPRGQYNRRPSCYPSAKMVTTGERFALNLREVVLRGRPPPPQNKRTPLFGRFSWKGRIGLWEMQRSRRLICYHILAENANLHDRRALRAGIQTNGPPDTSQTPGGPCRPLPMLLPLAAGVVAIAINDIE